MSIQITVASLGDFFLLAVLAGAGEHPDPAGPKWPDEVKLSTDDERDDVTLRRRGDGSYADESGRFVYEQLSHVAAAFTFMDDRTPCPFCSELRPGAARTEADNIALRFPPPEECLKVVPMQRLIYYDARTGRYDAGDPGCFECGAC